VIFGLDEVTVIESGQTALGEVDVEVAPGSITVLIGADGAGKSTAAGVMVGLRRPDGGRVRRPPRRKIGYQPEAAGTWAELTVAENLAFVAAAHKLGRSQKPRIDALLEVTDLTGATDRLAGQLSGGMRQKLAVAMAMLPDPELVVLDEPTTGLDPISRSELWRLLARSAGEGTAVLATTSYLDEAERADDVVVLDEGRVLATGSAAEIRAGFIGTIAVSDVAVAGDHAWRRGPRWRVWSPDGSTPPGLLRVAPDLEDVVTAAALLRRESA
jgi:ABC-2 type transport system ATP-binding protein